jgi:polysaccharide pyruvyl transferase WcaK-like protein
MAYTFFIGGNGYGAGNIGDDAVLLGLYTLLNQQYPSADFIIATQSGRTLPFLPANTRFVDRQKADDIQAAVKKADIVVSGGGTMIGDELTLAFPLQANDGLFSIARKYGKKAGMLSVGANSLQTSEGMMLTNKILKTVDFVSVRDPESKQVCDNFFTHTPITLAADPAYILTARETQRSREVKKHLSSNEKKIIGVNVVNEVWRDQHNYKRCIAAAIERFCDTYNYYPVFFQTEVRGGIFYDAEANSETRSYMSIAAGHIPNHYYDPQEMLDIMSVFDFVFSMRMHALIFSAILGIPHTTMARIDKVNNFLQLFGRSAPCTIGKPSAAAIFADMKECLGDAHYLQISLKKRVEKQQCLFRKSIVDINAHLIKEVSK